MSWLEWSTPTFLDDDPKAQTDLALFVTGLTFTVSGLILMQHQVSFVALMVVRGIMAIGLVMFVWYLRSFVTRWLRRPRTIVAITGDAEHIGIKSEIGTRFIDNLTANPSSF